MARITVSDCIKDRFKLVVIASQRARNITSGASISVDRNRDKDTVIALREIAAQNVSISALEEEVVKRLQKNAIIEPMIDDSETTEVINDELELSPSSEGWYVDESDSDVNFNDGGFVEESMESEDIK